MIYCYFYPHFIHEEASLWEIKSLIQVICVLNAKGEIKTQINWISDQLTTS